MDQHVAHVDLVLVEAGVLPPEHDGHLLRVAPAGVGEVPHGDGDPRVVPVALGGDPAGAGHQEAALHGLLQRVHDVHVVQDVGSVLRPAVRIVA